MKFLADENISPVIVKELRKQNHHVFDIKEENLRGLSDKEIARIAASEKRIILTHDTTFVSAIDPSLKIKIFLISFKEKQAKREKMRVVGWYIASKAKEIFRKKAKIHLKLEAENLKIFPLNL